jgi:hypothetical protein
MHRSGRILLALSACVSGPPFRRILAQKNNPPVGHKSESLIPARGATRAAPDIVLEPCSKGVVQPASAENSPHPHHHGRGQLNLRPKGLRTLLLRPFPRKTLFRTAGEPQTQRTTSTPVRENRQQNSRPFRPLLESENQKPSSITAPFLSVSIDWALSTKKTCFCLMSPSKFDGTKHQGDSSTKTIIVERAIFGQLARWRWLGRYTQSLTGS